MDRNIFVETTESSIVNSIRAAKTQPPEKNGRGAEPPLVAPNPPYPPLILGSGAGLGQKCGEVVPGGWRGWGREKRRRRRGEGRGWCGERVGREERGRGGRRERKEEKGHRFRSNYFE